MVVAIKTGAKNEEMDSASLVQVSGNLFHFDSFAKGRLAIWRCHAPPSWMLGFLCGAWPLCFGRTVLLSKYFSFQPKRLFFCVWPFPLWSIHLVSGNGLKRTFCVALERELELKKSEGSEEKIKTCEVSFFFCVCVCLPLPLGYRWRRPAEVGWVHALSAVSFWRLGELGGESHSVLSLFLWCRQRAADRDGLFVAGRLNRFLEEVFCDIFLCDADTCRFISTGFSGV